MHTRFRQHMHYFGDVVMPRAREYHGSRNLGSRRGSRGLLAARRVHVRLVARNSATCSWRPCRQCAIRTGHKARNCVRTMRCTATSSGVMQSSLAAAERSLDARLWHCVCTLSAPLPLRCLVLRPSRDTPSAQRLHKIPQPTCCHRRLTRRPRAKWRQVLPMD